MHNGIEETNLVLDVSPGGGCSWEILVGVHVLPDPISDKKKCPFPHLFFRPGLKNRGVFSDLKLLWLERQQKDFLKFISNSHITILSMSVGIEAIDSSLRFPSSLEKPNPIPDQNVQSLYPFSDPTPWGGNYLYGLDNGVPPWVVWHAYY